MSSHQMKMNVFSPFARPKTIIPTMKAIALPSTLNSLILVIFSERLPIR